MGAEVRSGPHVTPMNSATGRRPYSILFDWGTTNLRAYLIDDSGRMIDCYAAKLGVKHVSRDEYPSIIQQVSGEWVKQYAVATIVLAGMVGGNLGWRDVPMVQSPAGAEQIAAGMFQVDLTEMPPVRIVPGVFCKSAAGPMRRWNVPLVVVANNNSALGQGLRSVKKLYAGRDGRLADLALFGHVDFARVAEVFGIRGARVEQPQDIIPTIKSALAAGEPFLVDVVTDPDCNPEPPWMPPP